jgi:uncharacterized protein involved in outer membrane biogenesis
MDTRTPSKPRAAESPSPPRTRRHSGAKIAAAVVAGLVLAAALFLLLFDWDWLRGPIARYASARTGREVRIEGHLRVHPFSWTPDAEVGGLRIGNPAWAGPGDLAQVRALEIKARLLPLFIGRLDLPLVRLDQPRFDLIRDAQDRANWRFDSPTSAKPAELPPIQKFVIRDGALTMHDARRQMTLTGVVNAAETAGADGGGFELVGQGTMNAEAFLLRASGGPLIHVRRNQPYPFHLEVHAGRTQVAADAQLNRPFNLGDMHGRLQASGPNLYDLYPLTGVVFPATPAYRIATDFDRTGARFDFSNLRGTVGESDLEGKVTVDKPADRRKVTADLSSRRLVFSDLLAVIGGGPKASAARGGPKAPPPTPPGRLLPDARLQTDRLKTMDATLRYRAQSVQTARWPLRKVALDLTLDDGLLTIDPLDFEFPQGRLAGRVRVDARKATPATDLDMRLSNLGLQQLAPAKGGGPPPLEGTLQARAQLHGVGDSIHAAASTADGRVVMVVPRGKVRQAFAELLGINVPNGLYLLLSKDPRETDLRCAVAEFQVKGGVMQVSDAVFDTGVVRAQGKGSIDLKDERVDLRLDGQSKKPRLLRVWAPITLKGTLLHPQPGVDASKAAGQVGLAAAIGALFAPLAAILPFIEPGLAKDADCAGLIAEAKAQGAPARTSGPGQAASAAQPAKPQ